MNANINNQNDGISHSIFSELISSNLVGQVTVRHTPKRFYIQVQLGEQSKILITQRKKIKWFANLNTAYKYLREVGIYNFNVS